eukprot:5578051-Lingulodinium_polyedra.AAC.1
MDLESLGGSGTDPVDWARSLRAWRELYKVGLETDPSTGKSQFSDNVVVIVYDDLNSVTWDGGRNQWRYEWK